MSPRSTRQQAGPAYPDEEGIGSLDMQPLPAPGYGSQRRGRDVFAVLMITAGGMFLIIAAFLTALPLGLAIVGLLLIGAGVAAGYDSGEPSRVPVQ